MSLATQIESSRQPIDARLRALRERAIRFEDEGDPFARALIVTDAYRDCADAPVVVKSGEALGRVLERIAPVVTPGQRLLSVVYRRTRVHGGVGDEDMWRMRALFPETHGFNPKWPAPPDVAEKLKWWRGRIHPTRELNEARRASGWLARYGVANPHGFTGGHRLPDHGILLNAGIGGLRASVADRLSCETTREQRDQLAAMDRCLDGLAKHCLLCARTARETAAGMNDGPDRDRLLIAANDCEALSISKPVSFAQALQLILFSNYADVTSGTGDAASFGRIDQLPASFFDADLAAGALNEDEAFDLVCEFIVLRWQAQTSANMTIGGVTPDGADATNALSYMFLEAMEATELTTNITVRVHRDTPDDYLRLCARVLRRSFGRPSLFNDDVTIPALVRKGVELEDARDYAPLGCVEVMIPGRTPFRTMCMGLSATKVLELVLNQGRCLVTGDQVWDDAPSSFGSFGELLDEHRRRVRQIVDTGIDIIREDEQLEPDHRPRPWLTVLSHGGVEAALDLTAGQPKYDAVGVTHDGFADVVNSLYAVRRVVFEEQRLSLDELRKALRVDWDGHEPLRQYVVNHLPRFGQGDLEINELARSEAAHYADCFERHETHYGGRFWPMVFGVTTALEQNKLPKTGATASGRRCGESLAPSLQPSLAGPQGSPTSLLRSIAAIDYEEFPGGISNVQELDPSLVEGGEGLTLLSELIRTFFDLGGMELSLNFLDEAKLRDAQKYPERHAGLMVRLFGLSARFIALTPHLQETIIERALAARRRSAE